MTTQPAKPGSITHDWFIIDAKDKTLGRLATEIARRLRGKHKPCYTPHEDTGDFIVVINARHVAVTGNKQDDKMYHWHTGYPGGIKDINFKGLQDKKPGDALMRAVKGMLPKNALGRKMIRKLRIYADSEHEHAAQQPQLLELD